MASQLDSDIDIGLIGAVPFYHACKMAKMEPILMYAIPSEVAAQSAKSGPTSIDYSKISPAD